MNGFFLGVRELVQRNDWQKIYDGAVEDGMVRHTPDLRLVARSPNSASLGPFDDKDPSAVRGELHRVVTSDSFKTSDRNRRFLHYVVEETLAGRGDRIKAYAIATLVFGRDEDFDPQLDPVVRMEARRVRLALERFYLLEGQDGVLRISLPKGGYKAEFHSKPFGRDLPATKAKTPEGLSIFVSTFHLEDVSGTIHPKFAEGFAQQLIVRLSRFREIEVFVAGPHIKPAKGRLVLSGSIVITSAVWITNVTLCAAGSGRVVWADSFESQAIGEHWIGGRELIADYIASALTKCVLQSTSRLRLGFD